jgi:hypothetical protein
MTARMLLAGRRLSLRCLGLTCGREAGQDAALAGPSAVPGQRFPPVEVAGVRKGRNSLTSGGRAAAQQRRRLLAGQRARLIWH